MSTQAAMDAQRNMNLYLAPEQLIANEANEKARPAERPEQRAARIKEMAESIRENGQEYPVLIVEVESDGVTTYEYVDGGCRVEAIASIDDGRQVWCSLVDSNEDLFKKAVTANLHRTQNSLLDMAYIVMEVRERNSWKGKGGGAKVASYLGIQPSRVTEYEKLLRATPPVKARIESGEIASLDAALKLMAVPEEDQPRVADRAREIADEEERSKPEPKRKKLAPVTPEQKAAFQSVKEAAKHDREKAAEKAKAVPVKAKHVSEAAREITGKGGPRAKSAIAEFFEAVTEAAYPQAAVKFADYFVQTWMAGEGTDRRARDLFDAAVHVGSAKPKPKSVPKAAAAPKVKAKAVKTAKPSAKPKAKGKK